MSVPSDVGILHQSTASDALNVDDDRDDADGSIEHTGTRALSESMFRSLCGSFLGSAVVIAAISTVFGVLNANAWAAGPAALGVGCTAVLCARAFALTVGGSGTIADVVYTWWRFVGRWLAFAGFIFEVVGLTGAFWGTQR